MNLDQFWAGVQSILNSLNIEMSNQELLTCLGIGVAAGWLASQIVGGKAGIIRYLVAGLLGAFLGPIVLGWIGI